MKSVPVRDIDLEEVERHTLNAMHSNTSRNTSGRPTSGRLLSAIRGYSSSTVVTSLTTAIMYDGIIL